MADAVIVSTARTGIGRAYRGALNNTHGATVAAHAITHAVQRAGVEPGEIEDVILGCALPEGATGQNIARQAALRAGLPVTTAGVTVNRFCSSGMQAIAMAAHRVIVDRVPIMVAGGVESISLVQNEHMNLHRLRESWLEEHKPEIYMTMIETAEVVATRYYITREAQDEYALVSQQRTGAGQTAGRFDAEIVPFTTRKLVQDKATGETREEEVTLTRDEGNRPDTTREGLAALKPVTGEKGHITAGNASQLSDGASACVVMDAKLAERRGVRPLGIVLVVLAGTIHPDGQALLEQEARVVVCPEETEAPFVKEAADADGILFRVRPRCTESLMAACPKLRVVGRHGVGLDTVDIPAATRLGVAVVHAPGANAQAVAEHALMLMLVCAKRALQVDRDTRAGTWTARGGGNIELAGRTLGIVGIGNIGRRVAKFAGAIGMRVLAYDTYVPADEVRRRGAEPVASLEALLPQVDVLTCHTPLTDETRGMINDTTLALMKKGAIYVNTSRGPVQQERALFEALTRGQLASAGIDVFEEEPAHPDNALFNLPNVVVSSHVAGVTEEARRQTSVQVAGEMLRVLRGEKPGVLVNPDVWPRLGRRG